MDSKIPEIKPMVLEPWVIRDNSMREPDSVKPVPKDEGAVFAKLSGETANRQGGKPPSMNPERAKQVTEEIERYLSDMNVSISFEIYDKTGDLIVKMINRDTKEVIRQLPPEDLLRLRQKFEELRGVLFTRKA
jgi:flagellar protein FlaG